MFRKTGIANVAYMAAILQTVKIAAIYVTLAMPAVASRPCEVCPKDLLLFEEFTDDQELLFAVYA